MRNISHHKRIAELIAEKRGEEYSHVVNHVRTRIRIRFALLTVEKRVIRHEGKEVEEGEREGSTNMEDLSLKI